MTFFLEVGAFDRGTAVTHGYNLALDEHAFESYLARLLAAGATLVDIAVEDVTLP